jgi:hypothetical protein
LRNDRKSLMSSVSSNLKHKHPEVRQVREFVQSLDVKLPPIEEFWTLGDATALRVRQDGTFFRSNYERGILLYALVAKHRPNTVLEFGTGRGYGSLCMAWAMCDFGITGTIHTIDMVSPSKRFKWPIIWPGSDEANVRYLSRHDVWQEVAKSSWMKHIDNMVGLSGAVMQSYSGRPVDFAFIDAGHGYRSVRHDFIMSLHHASGSIGVLFDDYSTEDWGLGTQKLVKDDVSPYCSPILIQTDRRWSGGEKEHLPDDYSGMVWVKSDCPKQWLAKTNNALNLLLILYRYRVWEIYYRLRLNLGERLRSVFISNKMDTVKKS